MLRSATFKLTMYYLLIIAVISLGFSVALYHVASNDLASGLQQQTERISNDFPVFLNSPYLDAGSELAQAKRHIIGRLVVFNVLVLIASGVASYALARRTLQPIEHNHERQKRFTADVSHELRTPLTALTMESQVALMDTAATKTQLRQVIASNVEEAEKLTILISNLLQLSQLDATGAAPLRQAVVLNQALSAATEQINPIAQARSITIDYRPGPEVTVQADPSMLSQLFVILLDNAVKYSPSDSVVHCSAELRGEVVAVTIRDEGVGIAKDNLEHVFERFYRADSARSATAPATGYGLGLSIAKLIADSHQASISITSQPGKGTTAEVTFARLFDQPTTVSSRSTS